MSRHASHRAEARVKSGGLRGARPRRWPSHLGRQGRVSAEARGASGYRVTRRVALRGTVGEMKPFLFTRRGARAASPRSPLVCAGCLSPLGAREFVAAP